MKKIKNSKKELKDEVGELEMKLSQRGKEWKLNVGDNGGEELSSKKTKSVEFVSAQYDDLMAFKASASKEVEEIRARLDKIFETCNHIQKLLDAFELYSFQLNIKIVGIPIIAEREHPEQTANLCLQLL